LIQIEDNQDKDGYLFKLNKLLKEENKSLKDALEAKGSLTRTLYNKLNDKSGILSSEDKLLEEEFKKNLILAENLDKNLVKERNDDLLKNIADQTINDLYFQLKLREYENIVEKSHMNKKIEELLHKNKKLEMAQNNLTDITQDVK